MAITLGLGKIAKDDKVCMSGKVGISGKAGAKDNKGCMSGKVGISGKAGMSDQASKSGVAGKLARCSVRFRPSCCLNRKPISASFSILYGQKQSRVSGRTELVLE